MRWHHRIVVALREWFRPSARDRELNEELQFHFERQVQANLDAGMQLEQARRAAALAIGNVEPIREAARDGHAGALVRQFARDAAYGGRLLRNAPGFSLATIAIVAIGVGAVTAIFSVVYGVALSPLPFAEPDRLVNIWTRSPKFGATHFPVNGADHRDWLAQNHVFADIALVRNLANFNLIGEGEPERVLGARMSSNLLPLLGVSPVIGRAFTEEEDEIGRERVVLLSDGLWRRRFGADPAVVGRSINLSGVPHLVVGVMARDFHYPGREFQLWTPLTINPGELTRKVPGNNLIAVARLKPGVTVAEAQSEMETIAARLAPFNTVTSLTGISVVPMHADLLANVRTALYVVLAAVLCLLFVAAFNLSSLLSARAAARGRELAVRLALGATRTRVAIQAVAEILPLLAAGGILGVVLAVFTIRWFVPLAPSTLPRVENISVNGAALGVAILVLLVTGVIAAVLPAVQAWHADLSAARDARTVAGGARQTRARSMLVMTQIALSLPLLTGGVLLARTFSSVASIDPGFNPRDTISLHLAIPRTKYRSDGQIAQLIRRFIERVAAVPGVAAVGGVNRLPLSGTVSQGFIEFDAPDPPEMPAVDWRIATPDYFNAIGIPLVEGRSFDARDTAAAAPVGIIDERIARAVWPHGSAVGKRFRVPARLANNVPQPWVEIVGVVGRIRHDGLDADTRPQIYWPYDQEAQDRIVLVVRGHGDVAALIPPVISAIHDVDREQPVYDVRTMEDVVERSLAQRWLNAVLVGTFALVALALCSIGVYGVIAFGVTSQRREFGIRMALGASRRGIAASVVARGLMISGVGAAIGLGSAIALTRAMAPLLYGVPAGDFVSLAMSTLTILAVALSASYLPARRAARFDPATTLRAE